MQSFNPDEHPRGAGGKFVTGVNDAAPSDVVTANPGSDAEKALEAFRQRRAVRNACLAWVESKNPDQHRDSDGYIKLPDLLAASSPDDELRRRLPVDADVVKVARAAALLWACENTSDPDPSELYAEQQLIEDLDAAGALTYTVDGYWYPQRFDEQPNYGTWLADEASSFELDLTLAAGLHRKSSA